MITTQGRDRDRDRLRYLIARDWRRSGRTNWTDAEIAEAIETALARRGSSPRAAVETGSDPPPPPHGRPVQQTLFGANDATRATRAGAAAASRGAAPDRRQRAVDYVASCGHRGATREEIADGLNLPLQSVCPLVFSLTRSGQLLTTSRTRQTRAGRSAEVVVVPSCNQAEGDRNR